MYVESVGVVDLGTENLWQSQEARIFAIYHRMWRDASFQSTKGLNLDQNKVRIF